VSPSKSPPARPTAVSPTPALLTDEVRESAQRSVLCWLATVDGHGQPNVSPKEIFAPFDASHLVIANIASPTSVRNIGNGAVVCVAFVDVFVQKGFKIVGTARHVRPAEADFAQWAEPLRARVGDRFPIHGVIVVAAASVEPIVAPSYRLHPDETTEAAQIASAMRSYRVRPADDAD